MKKTHSIPITIAFAMIVFALIACGIPASTSEPQIIIITSEPTITKEIIIITSEPTITKEITIPDVSGTWNCTNGRVYEFIQDGNQFTWFLESLNEKGNGIIIGNDAAVSWAGNGGIGTAICKILTNSEGRATRIDCDNKVSFTR